MTGPGLQQAQAHANDHAHDHIPTLPRRIIALADELKQRCLLLRCRIEHMKRMTIMKAGKIPTTKSEIGLRRDLELLALELQVLKAENRTSFRFIIELKIN